MEFRVLEKKERFLWFSRERDLPWPRKVLADGRWILSRSSDLVGQNLFWPRDFGRGRAFVSRIDRNGRSVPIRESGRAQTVSWGSRLIWS
ncbi:unnamed protein product [Microthlaspi erraticum]|uniref:Uncharacterized protein n=1 Tax=Microthlaspi erraticum TaxID=1685480 RepID=A0A6D2IP23_9BRAS|nr:unnamed protein product [Microthlaspi erraticum]